MLRVTGPGDQQHVRVARTRDQVDPESFQVVEGIRRGRDLQLASVAASGVDLAHVKRAAEPAADALAEAVGRFVRGSGPACASTWRERAPAGRRIDVERRGPRELLAGVGGDLDVVRDADRLLGTCARRTPGTGCTRRTTA